MRLFPKIPNTDFWHKWNMLCVMFIGSCLLVTRFYQNLPEVVESAENLMWFGGGGLALGLIMIYLKNRKK